MKAGTLYRIAAVVFVLFAAGHTIGFLRFVPPSAQGAAVLGAMRDVHFTLRGASYSYAGFYDGFGLSVTVYLVFSAFLAWHLAQLAAKRPEAIGALGGVFCAMQVVQLAICLVYFFAAPAVLSAIVALLLGAAAWRVRSSPRARVA